MQRRRRSKPEKPSAAREWLIFWLVVLVVSGVIGAISFRVGRDYFGKRLGQVDVDPGAPRIVAEVDDDAEEAERRRAEAKAPASAVVTVEDRRPAAAELRDIEEGEAYGEPQDGADTYAEPAEAKTEPEPPALEETQEPTHTQPTAAPEKFVVTAGSYSVASNASEMIATLAARGYKPYLETVSRDGQDFSRVNVAVVDGRTTATELRNELARSGIPAGIVALR